MVVVCYVDHVVCVDCAERGEAIAYYSEEGDEDAVDYVDDIDFSATTDVNPPDKEEDPGKAEERDKGSV